MKRQPISRRALIQILLLLGLTPAAAYSECYDESLSNAAALREKGNSRQAIAELVALSAKADPRCRHVVLGELGAALLQGSRVEEARATLAQAYQLAASDPIQRARYAIDLGSIAARAGNREDALKHFAEARALANDVPVVLLSAALNEARLIPEADRATYLREIFPRIQAVADIRQRIRYYLNLGAQARELGTKEHWLAHAALDNARKLAEAHAQGWLQIEALNELAHLYEVNQRGPDALRLTNAALAAIKREPYPDLYAPLQWRKGRLLRGLGSTQAAVESYRAAVAHLDTIRDEIPVEYVDGRSSFRDLLEPMYLDLAELLIAVARNDSTANRQSLLREARDTVERIKRSELEDYLGDRCFSGEAAKRQTPSVPEGVAVVYPIIFPDRVELIIETAVALHNVSSKVDEKTLNRLARGFAEEVRNFESQGFAGNARNLYDVLLKPTQPVLDHAAVQTLVVVPDGVLRLVPWSALHDGDRYLVEKYAVVTAPGLSVTKQVRRRADNPKMLLAGLSTPGPVVSKIPQPAYSQITGDNQAMPDAAKLTEMLTLPAVKDEVSTIGKLRAGSEMLDAQFTTSRFREALAKGDYSVVHIASHGVFSSRGDMSFIMAYDDILTLEQLQDALRTTNADGSSIDLLTLSACQTAEGDDRAPLGIAGAALRANVSQALGSLWPVADDATKRLMAGFYEGLEDAASTRAQALRKAQLQLLSSKQFQHPFFWAPFILVGGWG